jgi:two-component system, NtrC family, sensor histidine kinase HydH
MLIGMRSAWQLLARKSTTALAVSSHLSPQDFLHARPFMQVRDALFLLAALLHLAIALLAARQLRSAPMRIPLALLGLDFFGWNFAAFANRVFHAPHANAVDAALTVLGPPIVLQVVLAFVARSRQYRAGLAIAYVLFGLLAASAVLGITSASGQHWIDSPGFAALFGILWLLTLAADIALLQAHWRAHPTPAERALTRVVALALAAGALGACFDVARDLGAEVPGLAPAGAALSALLIAYVALRRKLLGEHVEHVHGLYLGAIALITTALATLLLYVAPAKSPIVALGFALLAICTVLVIREVVAERTLQQARLQRLAVVGRLTAQMSHDLKNPLAALLGAVQILEAEASESSREFTELVRSQARRIQTIVEQYDRLSRVVPVMRIVAIRPLLERAISLQRIAAKDGITLRLDCSADIGEYEVDPDLISAALDNLVQNAFEACPSGGEIEVGATARCAPDGEPMWMLSVQDNGAGIDPRNLENAFADFHTTKATGSGLGLAFVRRVAIAHSGRDPHQRTW